MRRPLVDGVDGPSFAPQVFHEAMHDDARTNLAIALTAAEKGAAVANYCEVTSLLKDAGGRAQAACSTALTNERFDVRAKAVVFCGGPYTDALRKLGDEKAEDAAAAPLHACRVTRILLPAGPGLARLQRRTAGSCFPAVGPAAWKSSMDIASMAASSDLISLPWLGHTLVGTTDAPSAAETRPTAPEDEVQWLLSECSRTCRGRGRWRTRKTLSTAVWPGLATSARATRTRRPARRPRATM